MPEDTKEKYRRWWLNRSPEDRARLRALNGTPVTIHELVFLGDPDGLPLATEPGQAADPLAALHLSPDGPPAEDEGGEPRWAPERRTGEDRPSTRGSGVAP